MLQVTDRAAGVFRGILDRDDVTGSAIRLTPEPSAEPGSLEIAFLAADGANAGDVETEAAGVRVLVASDLAEQLDDAVLDAEETPQGPSFRMLKQAS